MDGSSFQGVWSWLTGKNWLKKSQPIPYYWGAGLSHNKLPIIVEGARKLQIVGNGSKYQSNQCLGLKVMWEK